MAFLYKTVMVKIETLNDNADWFDVNYYSQKNKG